MGNIWQAVKSALGAGGASVPRRQRTPGTAPAAKATHPYRACSIEPGPDRCAAVQTLDKKRFLQVDVPPLPLAECGRLQCDCRYRRHEDRRHQDNDRRLPGAAATELYTYTAGERRRVRGRRADD